MALAVETPCTALFWVLIMKIWLAVDIWSVGTALSVVPKVLMAYPNLKKKVTGSRKQQEVIDGDLFGDFVGKPRVASYLRRHPK